jgi:hypothetical protein
MENIETYELIQTIAEKQGSILMNDPLLLSDLIHDVLLERLEQKSAQELMEILNSEDFKL